MFGLLTNINEPVSKPLSVRRQMNSGTPIILIVEDDDDSRLMLKFLLETWKYDVIEAEDGAEALIIAKKACPDLILMDVKLPHLDGFEATRLIRQSAIINRVPVVFISGCAETFYRNAAASVGGNEYLVKPLDFEKLEKTLAKYVCHPAEIAVETSPLEARSYPH